MQEAEPYELKPDAHLAHLIEGGRFARFDDVLECAREQVRQSLECCIELIRRGFCRRWLIAHSPLAILPGSVHMTLTARTAWLMPMINDFFDVSPNKKQE